MNSLITIKSSNEKLIRSRTSRKNWNHKHSEKVNKGVSRGASIINPNVSTVVFNSDINPEQQKDVDNKMMKYLHIAQMRVISK